MMQSARLGAINYLLGILFVMSLISLFQGCTVIQGTLGGVPTFTLEGSRVTFLNPTQKAMSQAILRLDGANVAVLGAACTPNRVGPNGPATECFTSTVRANDSRVLTVTSGTVTGGKAAWIFEGDTSTGSTDLVRR